MATAPRSQRRQQLIDRLTALLPSSQTFRRWLQSRTPTVTGPLATEKTTTPPTSQTQQPEKPSPSPSPASPPPQIQQPEKPSPSPPSPSQTPSPPPPPPPPSPPPIQNDDPSSAPPVGFLMPGMGPPGSSLGLLTPSIAPNPYPSPPTVPLSAPYEPFLPPPSATPDLVLSRLPLDVLLLILEDPALSLDDLLALRASCAALRRVLPYRAVERKLTAQNYAGWRVVFEMGGNRYPGTTYGNRRLCGRCVLPRYWAGLVAGRRVKEFLVGLGVEVGEGWPGDRGMCFPCLWTVVVEGRGEGVGGKGMKVGEMARLAGIETKEEFLMLDGSKRKMCEKCSRDIHVNAVPCPHCTDFSEWCKVRREHGRRVAGWSI